MENLKKAAETLKMYPKLRLGERREGTNGKVSVHPTGPHKVKIVAEPTTTIVMKMGVATKVFKFLVNEDGQLYKWYVPVMNKDNTEGHYLIERLQFVNVGEEITLEMKKQGGRNFVEVLRAGDIADKQIEDDEEIEMEEESSEPIERFEFES